MPKINARPAPRPNGPVYRPATETEIARSERLLRDYESGLAIDKMALDDELIEHPEKFYHVTEQQAFAMSYRDQAKSEIDRVAAEADAEIRKDAELAEEKITEPQVKAQVTTNRAVQTANAEYAAWKLLEKRWAGLLSSFEARNKMLEKLVNLYTSNYWSGATGGSARSNALDRVASEVRRHGD